AFLLRHGNHVEAMRLLARIGVAREVLDDAEILLAAALEMAPDYVELRRDYACVLLDRHKHAEAIEQLDRLLKLDPKNIDYRTLRATATVGLGDHEDGIRGFTAVLADTSPSSRLAADLHLSIGHSLKTLGRRTPAIEAYKLAIAARPKFGDAYWSLANLKTYTFSDAEIAQLEAAEADLSTDELDRYHLCFALGKAHEGRADYARSFRYSERGNALKRAASRYRAELVEQNTARQKQLCTREFFRERAGYGAASREPILILGLPRAGSTLLEQILASHSEVEGTQELANVPRVVLDLQGYDPDLDNPRYPGCLEAMTAEEFRALGEKYLADTRIYRGGKPRFIDKMPNNFRHIGLIHLMLPNARIIDARREPMACCFGNLKQLYARGQEFAYSVDDIARYYRTYLELMEHWDTVLPGRVLRVHYEDVVEDLEGSVRRLLEFCELPFEPACGLRRVDEERGEGGGDRRRGGRLQRALPPHEGRLEGRRARRARPADVRLHVARRRGLPHPEWRSERREAPGLHHRALRRAREDLGAVLRPAPHGGTPAGRYARAHGVAEDGARPGALPRTRDGAPHTEGGQEAPAAHRGAL